MTAAASVARFVRQAGFAPLTDAAGQRLNFRLWLILCVTNAADVIGTAHAFSVGVGELNPLVEFFYLNFGMASVAAFKAVFLTLLYFLIPWIRGFNRGLFVFACIAYVLLTFVHVGFALIG